MRLEIKILWSPNLDPPSDGHPADPSDYELLLQIRIGAIGRSEEEVFGLTVCSSSALGRVQSGTFVTDTLVLDPFDWNELERRLTKLLHYVGSCPDWEYVVKKLSGFLQYGDA